MDVEGAGQKGYREGKAAKLLPVRLCPRALWRLGKECHAAGAVRVDPWKGEMSAAVEPARMTEQACDGEGAEDSNVEASIMRRSRGGDGQSRRKRGAVGQRDQTDAHWGPWSAVEDEAD